MYFKILFIISTFVIITYSFAADDEKILHEGLQFIEKAQLKTQTSSCEKTPTEKDLCESEKEKYVKLREHYLLLIKNPEKLGYPKKVRIEGLQTPKYDKDMAQTFEEASNLAKKCSMKKFKKCFSNLKETIEQSELEKLFEEFKNDPLFRMNYPAIHCFQRAYLLSEKLTKLGYKVSLLHIGIAPTLIAKNLNHNDQIKNEDAYDYGGIHWVVSVESKNADGKTEKMILDPQFATKPLSYESYFVQTIGQNCHKRNYETKHKSSNININSWKCGYKEYEPNRLGNIEIERPNTRSGKYFETDHASGGERVLNDTSACGFENSKKFQKEIISMNKSFKGTPENETKPDGDAERKTEILAAYETQYKNLQSLLTYLEQELQTDKPKEFHKRDQQDYKAAKKLLKDYKKIIDRVRANTQTQ